MIGGGPSFGPQVVPPPHAHLSTATVKPTWKNGKKVRPAATESVSGTTCAPQVAARYSPDVRCLVRLDLLGRTGPARLRLRVRFGVTDGMPTLSLARSGGLDRGNGGIE